MTHLIQTGVWMVAGTCLFIFLKRRRTRKQN
jgi:hypothetical protein